MTMRFVVCERGSTAMTFALMSTCMAGMVGLSIDLTRYLTVKNGLQIALDAAVLAVASDKQAAADGNAAFDAFMKANWKSPHGASVPTTVVNDGSGRSIQATADSILQTTFARVIGFETIKVRAESYASFGINKVDLALALDVTGSMTGTRIAALKTAAKNMTAAIYDMPGASSKIRVSVVPFANYVNVGTSYRGQNWLAVEADRTENQCYMTRTLVSKSGCSISRVPVTIEGQGTVYVDQETCTDYQYGPEVQQCGVFETRWNGCVGSRPAPLNTQSRLTATNPVPGLMNYTCSAPLTRLSTDRTTQDSAIDALSASGETYLPAGLMWGWRTISPNGPFGDSTATSGADKPRRILVVMTDGENTRSQYGQGHDGADGAAADTLTAELCREIKREDIEIYAVAYEVTNPSTLNKLKSCASSEATFFDASDEARLTQAFETIARSLSLVRLTR
jgi:Flp pilus assembly protein TadG